MPAGDQSNVPHIQLAGWIENPRKAETLNTHTLKEVEYGRRFLECLSIHLTRAYAGMRLK